jgi:hypothetical protein
MDAPTTKQLTIEYPAELLWVLQQEPEEFADEARHLSASKLQEMGRISTGLAAQFAGVPRTVFFCGESLWSFAFWRRVG